MRSRYAAFVLGNVGYLVETWHPDFRPGDLTLDPGLRWVGLEIISDATDGPRAEVEFEARVLASGRVSGMHERSDFVLQDGRWLYTRGDQLPPSFTPWKPARNEVCPCGSEVKFKRCCGAS